MCANILRLFRCTDDLSIGTVPIRKSEVTTPSQLRSYGAPLDVADEAQSA